MTDVGFLKRRKPKAEAEDDEGKDSDDEQGPTPQAEGEVRTDEGVGPDIEGRERVDLRQGYATVASLAVRRVHASALRRADAFDDNPKTLAGAHTAGKVSGSRGGVI
jgi:hypothetical protein